LREARAQDVSLPEFFGADEFLFGAVIDDPDFRAVVLRVANQHKREKRLVGLQVDLVMQLGNERAQLFQKTDPDLLEVAFSGAGRPIGLIVGTDILETVIEADGPRLGWNLPLRGTEENTEMCGINLSSARRDRVGFNGTIDHAEDNGVACHLNDDTATGKIRYDFVRLRERGRREHREPQDE